MARIKFYNKKTGTWEYADIAQGSSSGLPLPNTAKVGQCIVVKAVDENGAVTATEATDIKLQEKTVVPIAERQTVTPDDGYNGLSSVTVAGVPTGGKAILSSNFLSPMTTVLDGMSFSVEIEE